MISLLKKEISSFLGSVTGYIVICVFLVITSLFLWIFPGEMNIPESGYATLDGLFIIAPWVFLFLVPAITMRMIAEEKKTGTIELLLTRPLSDFQIILSKFLATVLIIIFALAPTLIYYISVYKLGNPVGNIDTGATWGSYIGLFFLASIYASIGLFSSSLTDNQIISFLLGVFLAFFLFIGFDYIASIFEVSAFNTLILNFGINEHYKSISRGVIDSREIIYFISLSVFFLILTKYSIQINCSGSSFLKVKNFIFKRFITLLVIILVINYISSQFFIRIDLTSDKRFTLAKPTKNTLNNLEDVVFIKVYLDGDLPIGFTKLKRSIKEMLDEFKVHTKNIEYNFINPYNLPNEERDALFRELYQKGIKATNLKIKGEDGLTQKIIFPGAIISYQNAETGINLLSNNPGLPDEVNLNNSIQALEYAFISIIKNITSDKIYKIAFIEGHGELDEFQVGDISKALSNYYQVDRGIMNGKIGILDDYKTIVIAKPQKPFNEKDKYVIDQYLMRGGKIIWFIDAVNVNADSLDYGSTIAFIRELNLNDQLFKYGIRINPVIVKDLQSNFILVNTALKDNQTKWTPVPWHYYPLISGRGDHPITKNINMIKTEYVNEVDTIISNADIKKKFLLWTSQASAIMKVPAFISLDEINKKPKPDEYNIGSIPIAVLVEGKFKSAFQNRMLEPMLGVKPDSFISQSIDTRIIVVADGDIIRNDVKHTPRGTLIGQLGYDKNTQHTFGNKEFVLNAINYLTDQDGLINLRSREYKLRLLDKKKIKKLKFKLILNNMILPIILVIILGIIINMIRKRKFS